MIEINTEFLRMWHHCPLQAALCTKHNVRPIDVVARRAMTQALGACAPSKREPQFRSDRVAKEFDSRWTAFQTSCHAMDLTTFYAIGSKMQEKAVHLAKVINTALDQGWIFIDGAHEFLLPLIEILGEEGRDVRVAHQVDCLMRKGGVLYLISFSTTSTTRFDKPRELSQCLEIQLSNLMGNHCLNENYGCAMVSSVRKQLLAAALDPADTRRAAGYLFDLLRGVRAAVVPQRPVNELNCGYCPVQSLCDDPLVYDHIHKEGVHVL